MYVCMYVYVCVCNVYTHMRARALCVKRAIVRDVKWI